MLVMTMVVWPIFRNYTKVWRNYNVEILQMLGKHLTVQLLMLHQIKSMNICV